MQYNAIFGKVYRKPLYAAFAKIATPLKNTSRNCHYLKSNSYLTPYCCWLFRGGPHTKNIGYDVIFTHEEANRWRIKVKVLPNGARLVTRPHEPTDTLLGTRMWTQHLYLLNMSKYQPTIFNNTLPLLQLSEGTNKQGLLLWLDVYMHFVIVLY